MQEKDWENQEEDCEGRTRCHLNILLGVAPASFSVFSLFSVFSVLAACMVAYGRHAVCMVLEYCTVPVLRSTRRAVSLSTGVLLFVCPDCKFHNKFLHY